MNYKLFAIILIVSGILLSSYLYYTVITQQELNYCSINQILNCNTVERSPYSRFYGIPLPILSILWFTTVLISLLFNRFTILEFLIFIAIIFIAYLVFTEIFLIGSICILCTITQALGISIIYPVKKLKKKKNNT
ncbi:MAG: vitamin K epoxide reductase family protein [Sulfolobaceae archaeon]